MKTIPLRTLLRDPKSVKRLTGSGHAVRITDGGVDLWDLTAVTPPEEAGVDARERLWDEHCEELLSGPPVSQDGLPSLNEMLEFSREGR